MSKNRFVAVMAVAALSAGCSGIGDGSKIETIRIVESVTRADVAATEIQAYTCVPTNLTLVGEFTRGDIGNFSSRATWTSSNPDVLRVTNFGDPVGDETDDVFLAGGVLLPQAVSDTPVTITADYLGLRAEVDVVIDAPTNLRIVPSKATIVPTSFQQFVVRAQLGGVDTDITASAGLRFATPDDEVALLSVESTNTGVNVNVTGVEEGTLALQTDFDVPCAVAPTGPATVTVKEIPPGGLALDFEEGFTGQLAEGTSQLLRLTARFNDDNMDGDLADEGEFQDLSRQFNSFFGNDVDGDGICELRLEDPGTTEAPNPPSPIVFGGILTGANIVATVVDADSDDSDPFLICAAFGSSADTDGDGPDVADNGVVSNNLTLTVLDRALETLTIEASDPCVTPETTFCTPLATTPDPLAPTIVSGELLQLDATGTFEGAYVQNITKNVTWSVSNTQLASVVNGVNASAGIVVTARDFERVEGCEGLDECLLTVTATWGASTSVTTDDTAETIDIVIQRSPDDAIDE